MSSCEEGGRFPGERHQLCIENKLEDIRLTLKDINKSLDMIATIMTNTLSNLEHLKRVGD